ncbi:predicted protein [Streptomyces viridosporus ATCC 14672]|uniref:Predicted protein n=1 Tax=Streptomyces viridosporus (strain ATCC 14672 / DSM 40746 / JCM 4963 / KCTC 9882 / NRRL B-12104 / FH 1290) TaxID=566461 RepID=D5ZVQ7_STRV1|nr:hypothetical protein [Streptomyces viridosporus]EFE65052.1 predicted protein [Streptomyces viridosporus ATCC 14672]
MVAQWSTLGFVVARTGPDGRTVLVETERTAPEPEEAGQGLERCGERQRGEQRRGDAAATSWWPVAAPPGAWPR